MFARHCLSSWLLLLIVLSLSLQSFAQPDSSSTGASSYQPIVTRVSGCTDVDNITINCPRSITFIIAVYGSGFWRNGTTLKGYALQITQDGDVLSYSPALTVNETCITANVQMQYGQFMNSDLFNVSIWVEYQKRLDVAGLSFAAPVPLFLTRVTGCPTISSDGLTASGCNYMTPLTMIGSGFNQIASDHYQINFGSIALRSYSFGTLMRVIDDSTIILDFAGTSAFIPMEAYTSAVAIQLMNDVYSLPWNLSTMYISYASIPSVEITSVVPMTNEGCVADQVGDGFRLSGCYAGRSIIRFSGRFIWNDTQIFVGNTLAALASSSRYDSRLMDVTVPIVDSEADVYYDVRIVNAATSLTLKNVISIVSTPQIASMTACVKKQNVLGVSPAWKAFCLEGETFSFNAVNLRGKTAPQVWFGPYECPNVRVISDRIVQCIVPRDPDGVASVQQGLFLSWPDHNSTKVAFELWDHPLAARVSIVTGDNCYQSADVNKPLQCLFDPDQGRNLTVMTSRLPPGQTWMYVLYYQLGTLYGSVRMPDVVVDESTGVMTCWLPGNFRGSLTEETIYQMAVTVSSQSSDGGSNVKPLVLVSQIIYDTDSSSASSDSTNLIVPLAAVLPLLVVLVLASVVYWRRRNNKSSQSIVFDGGMSSDDHHDVELASH